MRSVTACGTSARLAHSPWYDPKINRLTDHGNEPAPEEDLAARYYIAWDNEYLYLGAEVTDNINDVTDPAHEPKRWYYKDAICWFIEAPRTAASEKIRRGGQRVLLRHRYLASRTTEHGGVTARPARLTLKSRFRRDALQYAIRMQPSDRRKGDFTLEARIAMAPTLGVSSPDWRAPRIGDIYGLEIVHTDPDGGDYGGHFLIYGRGDDDSTWGLMELVGPVDAIERRRKIASTITRTMRLSVLLMFVFAARRTGCTRAFSKALCRLSWRRAWNRARARI